MLCLRARRWHRAADGQKGCAAPPSPVLDEERDGRLQTDQERRGGAGTSSRGSASVLGLPTARQCLTAQNAASNLSVKREGNTQKYLYCWAFRRVRKVMFFPVAF